MAIVRYTYAQILKQVKKMPKVTRQPKDSEIDFSDIPELTKEELKNFVRVGPGRPPYGIAARQLISIKLDQVLLAHLKHEAKQEGIGYQTHIHNILMTHVLERGRKKAKKKKR